MKQLFIAAILVSFLLSACQPGTNPTPEVDQEPLATPGPGLTPELPDSFEPDLPAEPPEATMQVGEDEQVAGIGSYCWPTEEEGVGLCADGIGIPSPPVPIVVESPFTAKFTIPVSAEPDTVGLTISPLEAEEQLESEMGGLSWWRPDAEDQVTRHLAPPYVDEFSLEPGLYLFNLFAQWQELGDVSYGFLVEVPGDQVPDSTEQGQEVTVVVVLADAGLNIRSEPDLSSEVIGYLGNNEQVDVTGQSPDGAWWQVVCPADVSGTCWISADPTLSKPLLLSEISLAGLIYIQNEPQPERSTWLIGNDGTPAPLLENSLQFPFLSPNGKRMIGCCAPRGETNLYLVDLETGESLQLTDTPDRYNYNPQWWPSNPETIVFVSNEVNPNDQPRPGPGNLTQVNTDGTGYRVLDPDHIVRATFSLSPDGQTIAYTHGDENSDIHGILTPWLYHLEDGPTPFNYSDFGLSDLPNLSFGNPAWSPDGRHLAWVVGGELDRDGEWKNGIAVFDLEEQSVDILHAHVPASCPFAWCPSTPIWSPDGQWLAWQMVPDGEPSGLLIVRPDGTGEQFFENTTGATWSPDSRYIVIGNILENLLTMIIEVEKWEPQLTGLPENIGALLWTSLDDE